MISQVLPRLWRHTASHQTATFLAGFSILQPPGLPEDFGRGLRVVSGLTCNPCSTMCAWVTVSPPPWCPPHEVGQVVLSLLTVLYETPAPRGLTKGYSLLHLNRTFMEFAGSS